MKNIKWSFNNDNQLVIRLKYHCIQNIRQKLKATKKAENFKLKVMK